MLNIIHYCYVPNTASTNRLIAYLNNIPSTIKVRVWFMVPSGGYDKLPLNKNNIEIINIWEKYSFSNSIIKLFSFYRIIRHIKSTLKRGDIIYSYNVPKYLKCFNIKGVRIYSERTEHPEINNYSSRLLKCSIKEHIKICKSLDGLFIISSALKKYYADKGVDSSKLHIINMTVDLSRFERLIKSENKIKYIAYCGNVSNSKDGVDKLLKSFSIVAKSIPDIKLFIIGKTLDSDAQTSNYNLASKLGILDRIVFTGEVDYNQIPNILFNAEMLLLSRPDSIQAEFGFPTKLGEYLATGVPVVVTNVGDIPKFLENEKNALISSPADNKDFADKIIWGLKNKEKAIQIGLEGKKVALKNFNAMIETQKLLKFINDENSLSY